MIIFNSTGCGVKVWIARRNSKHDPWVNEDVVILQDRTSINTKAFPGISKTLCGYYDLGTPDSFMATPLLGNQTLQFVRTTENPPLTAVRVSFVE